MNSIAIENISKRYIKNWLFKNVSVELISGDCLAVAGHNGSGKSTLLKIITGFVTPTQGTISYKINNSPMPPENYFRYISMAAPYMDLIEDFTLLENIKFFNKFKKLYTSVGTDEVIEIAFLSGAENKQLKNFSSGMKQRLKLSLAFLSDVPFLFLDEPHSNLDAKGKNWYHQIFEKYTRDKIIIICTNNLSEEAPYCNKQLNIEDYK